jgi:hypothetical protein
MHSNIKTHTKYFVNFIGFQAIYIHKQNVLTIGSVDLASRPLVEYFMASRSDCFCNKLHQSKKPYCLHWPWNISAFALSCCLLLLYCSGGSAVVFAAPSCCLLLLHCSGGSAVVFAAPRCCLLLLHCSGGSAIVFAAPSCCLLLLYYSGESAVVFAAPSCYFQCLSSN